MSDRDAPHRHAAVSGTQVSDTGKKIKLPGHPASLRGVPK